MRLRSLSLLVGLLIATLRPMPLSAQNGDTPLQREQSPPSEQDVRLQRERAKKLNQDRHAALQRDTDKLLKLTTELKDYVDKSNENVLSLDVVKKAEEIEKLARSVKDKMKGY